MDRMTFDVSARLLSVPWLSGHHLGQMIGNFLLIASSHGNICFISTFLYSNDILLEVPRQHQEKLSPKMGEVYTESWSEQYTFSWHSDTLTPWHWLFNNTDNGVMLKVETRRQVLNTRHQLCKWLSESVGPSVYWYSVFSGPRSQREQLGSCCVVLERQN